MGCDIYLSDAKEAYIDEDPDPEYEHFNLYWDNDIVRLTKDDVIALIPILTRWLNGKVQEPNIP